jgi:hypothetical protein
MRSSLEGPTSSGPSLLRRRDFLAFGSAGLLSLCLGDVAWGQSLSAADALVRPMSVGFIEGSEQLKNLRRLPLRIRRPRIPSQTAEAAPLRIVPAELLTMGDTSLMGRPLHLTVHGLYPPAALGPKQQARLPLAMDLDVLFPSPDPAFPEPIPFFAWSFRRQPGWNPSPPVSFVFPLDWEALPELVLRVVPAGGGSPIVFRTRFTVDYEAGRPRLQRGVYALGTMPGVWRDGTALAALARTVPAELASILLSVEPEEAE